MRITEQYWAASLEAAEQAARAASPHLQAEFLRLARGWAELARDRQIALALPVAWPPVANPSDD